MTTDGVDEGVIDGVGVCDEAAAVGVDVGVLVAEGDTSGVGDGLGECVGTDALTETFPLVI